MLRERCHLDDLPAVVAPREHWTGSPVVHIEAIVTKGLIVGATEDARPGDSRTDWVNVRCLTFTRHVFL